MALCAAAPTIELLFALRVLAGMAAGGVIPTSLGMIGDRVAMASRQVAISRFLAAVILGQLAGSSVSGLLAAWIGWRGVFGLAAALTASGGARGDLRLREEGPAPARAAQPRRGARALPARAHEPPRALPLRLRVRRRHGLLRASCPMSRRTSRRAARADRSRPGSCSPASRSAASLYSALVTWLLRVLGLGRMFVSGGVRRGRAPSRPRPRSRLGRRRRR